METETLIPQVTKIIFGYFQPFKHGKTFLPSLQSIQKQAAGPIWLRGYGLPTMI
jgi:hypothetical protein